MYIAALSNHIAIITVPGLIFYLGLKDHFLENAVSRRPLLLLLDGHSSHIEPQSIQFAKENRIVIFCLPPHTTHECQPLDVDLFGPLKRHWQQECHKFYQKHLSLVISKLNFNLIFRQAWLRAVSPCKHLWRIQKRWCLSLQSKCSADA